jgi:hypothetical protein
MQQNLELCICILTVFHTSVHWCWVYIFHVVDVASDDDIVMNPAKCVNIFNYNSKNSAVNHGVKK